MTKDGKKLLVEMFSSDKEILLLINGLEITEYQKNISYTEKIKIEERVRIAWKKVKDTSRESLLYNDIYCKLYYSNKYTDAEIKIYLDKAQKAFNEKNYIELEKIFDNLFEEPKARHLNWHKEEILSTIKCNLSEIEDILSKIKTIEEADIVLAAVCSSNFLLLLPKGYSEAKKIKQAKKKFALYDTYEHMLRRNRRILEKQLQEIGVGRKRSQKISQILLSI